MNHNIRPVGTLAERQPLPAPTEEIAAPAAVPGLTELDLAWNATRYAASRLLPLRPFRAEVEEQGGPYIGCLYFHTEEAVKEFSAEFDTGMTAAPALSVPNATTYYAMTITKGFEVRVWATVRNPASPTPATASAVPGSGAGR